jgi:WASH complex subunit 7
MKEARSLEDEFERFCAPLVLYGEGAAADVAKVEDGDAQLQLGRVLPLLQDTCAYAMRIQKVIGLVIQQLASVFSMQRSRSCIDADGIHLEPMFETLMDLLGLCIRLDAVLLNCVTLREHWVSYKRWVSTSSSFKPLLPM